MMTLRLHSYLFFSCLALLLMPVAGQQAQASPELGQKIPLHIEADKMTSLEKQRAVVFSGNVKARQGELQINSDEMTVYHAEEGAQNQGGQQGQAQIEKMHAKGHVEIIQNDFVATGDEAEYFSTTGKVIITGNAKIIQNNNMVTGHKVEMDLNEGSTVIIPDGKNNGRVVGYFYPANADQKDDDAKDNNGDEQVPAQQQDTTHGDTGN